MVSDERTREILKELRDSVLAFDEDRHIPIVVAPEKCTGCHFCDTHCPDLAIVVRRL